MLESNDRADVAARPNALALMSEASWHQQFEAGPLGRLESLATLTHPRWLASVDDPRMIGRLAEVEVLLTGWGAPPLDACALALLPRLSAVLHCGGSVRGLVTDELWDRGVVVSTSADLNAEPVAEYTFAAIVMAGKKAPFLAADARTHRQDWSYRGNRGPLGNVGLTIGLVGLSRIGGRVAQLVQGLRQVRCLVSDPFADPGEARALGATLLDLHDMLPQLDVLSVHAPALPATRHLIGAAELAALPDHATVINTARGSIIDTVALERECATGRLNAILDVVDPEPLPSSSVLYELPNVMLTPHLAGSLGRETLLMADAALDELERLVQGRPLARQVSRTEQAISA